MRGARGSHMHTHVGTRALTGWLLLCLASNCIHLHLVPAAFGHGKFLVTTVTIQGNTVYMYSIEHGQ